VCCIVTLWTFLVLDCVMHDPRDASCLRSNNTRNKLNFLPFWQKANIEWGVTNITKMGIYSLWCPTIYHVSGVLSEQKHCLWQIEGNTKGIQDPESQNSNLDPQILESCWTRIGIGIPQGTSTVFIKVVPGLGKLRFYYNDNNFLHEYDFWVLLQLF
jgi:hypothetical protein